MSIGLQHLHSTFSQRVTAQAAKCRVSEYMQVRTWCAQRASMKTLSQLLLVHLMSWWSLGLSFGLQHLHSTFSKGHITSFQMQSLRILHCVGAQRASSTFTLLLLRTWHLLCKEFDAWHCTHTIKWSTTKVRMTYQLVQAMEPEVPEHQEQHQHHSTHR